MLKAQGSFIAKLVIVSLCSCFTIQTFSQEDNGLYTEVELGAIYTSGNTEDENVQFKTSVNWIRNLWNYEFSIDGFRSSKEGELAAQRVYYVASTNYEFTENSFILGRLAYDDDRFSGYDSQSDISINYGRNLLTNRTNMELMFNVGVGLRQSRSEAGDFDEPILRLAGDYSWDLSETATFSQELSAESGSQTSIFRAESSIQTQIMDNLSLRFSINLKHQTEVPLGREKTDTETAITFVMSF